jgi:hypothetical protein
MENLWNNYPRYLRFFMSSNAVWRLLSLGLWDFVLCIHVFECCVISTVHTACEILYGIYICVYLFIYHAQRPKTLNERKHRPERLVALEKQLQPEIRVVADKENDHNAFWPYEITTTRCGRLLLQPRRDVRQVSTCRRVHVVSRHLANDRARSW